MMMAPLPAWHSVVLKGQVQDSLIIQEMPEVILPVYVSRHFRINYKQHLTTK